MKHFQTPEGEIRAISEGQEFLIESGWVELSDAELQAIISPPPTLEEVKQSKLAYLKRESSAEVEAIRSQYPEYERETWDQQAKEADAYLADNTAPTPMLSGIASGRGVTVAYLADRVVDKRAQFAALAGPIAGKRQRLEEDVIAATTVAEVEAIVW